MIKKKTSDDHAGGLKSTLDMNPDQESLRADSTIWTKE